MSFLLAVHVIPTLACAIEGIYARRLKAVNQKKTVSTGIDPMPLPTSPTQG